jgi:hypothetical protein
MNVDMRIDESGENQLSARINDFGLRWRGQVEPDVSDRFIFDEDVSA